MLGDGSSSDIKKHLIISKKANLRWQTRIRALLLYDNEHFKTLFLLTFVLYLDELMHHISLYIACGRGAHIASEILLSELISLSEIQLLALSIISLLAGIVLSVLILLSELSPRVRTVLSMLVSLSEMSKIVILQIPMIKA
ncbi:hypothetical protein JHK84_050324 [Glycine max]|nr:hypothetical protein JHK84_050324 [Glycine max]